MNDQAPPDGEDRPQRRFIFLESALGPICPPPGASDRESGEWDEMTQLPGYEPAREPVLAREVLKGLNRRLCIGTAYGS